MALYLKLFLQRFSRRILDFCRMPNPAQGWAVRWLHCSITGSQKAHKPSASLLKMQKILQGHPSPVRVGDMSSQLGIPDGEGSKCGRKRDRLHMLVYSTCLWDGESALWARESNSRLTNLMARLSSLREHTKATCLCQLLLQRFICWWSKHPLW